MPVCTNCAYPAQHVYTTYKTKSNIRLGVCPRCDEFQDPLIEHPDLVLLLDLILLKPHVFLHLLFNRGSPPFDADKGRLNTRDVASQQPCLSEASGRGNVAGVHIATPIRTDDEQAIKKVTNGLDWTRVKRIHDEIIKFGLISILAETTVRLLPVLQFDNTSSSINLDLVQIVRVMSMVILEGVIQHSTTLGLALLVLRWRGWYPLPDIDVKKSYQTSEKEEQRDGTGLPAEIDARVDGRRENFLPSLIPLTILYTSLLPLLLQLFLSIWHIPSAPSSSFHSSSIHVPLKVDSSEHTILSTIASVLSSSSIPATLTNNIPSNVITELQAIHLALSHFFEALRSEKTYTWTWAGTRLLGGMSAGFGLRVLLPTRPWETTAIILAGWVGAALIPGYLESLFTR
ncbi:hypothetical protein IAU59_002883 [Kwoniella sp. CBS 9459]